MNKTKPDGNTSWHWPLMLLCRQLAVVAEAEMDAVGPSGLQAFTMESGFDQRLDCLSWWFFHAATLSYFTMHALSSKVTSQTSSINFWTEIKYACLRSGMMYALLHLGDRVGRSNVHMYVECITLPSVPETIRGNVVEKKLKTKACGTIYLAALIWNEKNVGNR